MVYLQLDSFKDTIRKIYDGLVSFVHPLIVGLYPSNTLVGWMMPYGTLPIFDCCSEGKDLLYSNETGSTSRKKKKKAGS
jgi:hypothetical protein